MNQSPINLAVFHVNDDIGNKNQKKIFLQKVISYEN